MLKRTLHSRKSTSVNNKKYGRLKFPLLWLRGPGIVHADSLSQTKQSHQIFLYQCFTIMSSNIFFFLLKKKLYVKGLLFGSQNVKAFIF